MLADSNINACAHPNWTVAALVPIARFSCEAVTPSRVDVLKRPVLQVI
jgi:hypothetical protein